MAPYTVLHMFTQLLFCIFCLFYTFLWTARRPYRLIHIDALCSIYPTDPNTNPWIFFTKTYWELLVLKNSVFWVGHFGIFLLHPHENQSKMLGWVVILMITLVFSPKQHLHKHMQYSISGFTFQPGNSFVHKLNWGRHWLQQNYNAVQMGSLKVLKIH